ncbi:MAG: MerR family transcriptional regulator [Solirubrobacterales bacterium]
MSAPAKELLKISELAERADVPVATVRHYLREGLLPEPVKTSKNMAYYPPEFVERIRLIKRLQEERFMPLRVIKEALLAERTPEAEVLERFDVPARALRRLAEVGVLSPDASGYSQADVRIVEAVARFRAEGWNETSGFGARDVARLMEGLAPVVADELALMVERFSALDPGQAAELLESGMSPFPDLVGALHAKVLADQVERQRAGQD